jgi:hypothetical protein
MAISTWWISILGSWSFSICFLSNTAPRDKPQYLIPAFFLLYLAILIAALLPYSSSHESWHQYHHCHSLKTLTLQGMGSW